MAVFEVSYSGTGSRADAALSPAKCCVCCGNRCLKILSLCTERFHLEFPKLTSGMKELVLTWYFVGVRWRMASAEIVGVKSL